MSNQRKMKITDAYLSRKADDFERRIATINAHLERLTSLAKSEQERVAAEITTANARVRILTCRADVIERISKLGDDDVKLVKAALDAIENDSGSPTPAEEFLTTALLHYSTNSLVPRRARVALETFEQSFADMAGHAKAFTAKYPSEVAGMVATVA